MAGYFDLHRRSVSNRPGAGQTWAQRQPDLRAARASHTAIRTRQRRDRATAHVVVDRANEFFTGGETFIEVDAPALRQTARTVSAGPLSSPSSCTPAGMSPLGARPDGPAGGRRTSGPFFDRRARSLLGSAVITRVAKMRHGQESHSDSRHVCGLHPGQWRGRRI